MKKQKIYISGQISGLTKKEYMENFAAAERMLKNDGYDVCNPTTMFGWLQPLFARLPYHFILCVDLYMLSRCHGIYVLDNHFGSRGARVELYYSKVFKIKKINNRYEQVQAATNQPRKTRQSRDQRHGNG